MHIRGHFVLKAFWFGGILVRHQLCTCHASVPNASNKPAKVMMKTGHTLMILNIYLYHKNYRQKYKNTMSCCHANPCWISSLVASEDEILRRALCMNKFFHIRTWEAAVHTFHNRRINYVNIKFIKYHHAIPIFSLIICLCKCRVLYLKPVLHCLKKTAPLRQVGINSVIFQIQKNLTYTFSREFHSE